MGADRRPHTPRDSESIPVEMMRSDLANVEGA